MIRKSAETTKIRIVYDASASATPDAPWLNDCLYPGPALQKKLWDVLIQQRAYPVVLAGDIKKAFLQIRIHKSERDALHFHWQTDLNSDVQTYRFTRVLFGLAPSPFLLGKVLECQLDTWVEKYPEEAERLCRSCYVDDLLTGIQDIQQAQTQEKIVQEIMSDATFELHKWHSNHPQLEDNPQFALSEDGAHPASSEDQTYAKQQLLVKTSESKLLGVNWDKFQDTIAVQFPSAGGAPSKHEVLAKLAKVYDPLGLASPTTLQGKQIYREVCDCKAPWDADIPENLRTRWQKWEQSLPVEVTTRRPLAPYQQPVISVVFSRTPRRWSHPNPGCGKSKISQERTNHSKVRVSQCAHGYQFSCQRLKCTEGSTRAHRLRVAGQHGHPSLDYRKWTIPTVRRQLDRGHKFAKTSQIFADLQRSNVE